MTSQKPETVVCDSMLYEALRIARVPDRLSLNAYKEVHEMAGTNVNTRLDEFEKVIDANVRYVRWGIGILVSLFTIFVSLIAIFSTYLVSMLNR